MLSREFFIYLHGFASSPQSAKARYLGDRFQPLQINLEVPDLNQPDVTRLALSRASQDYAAQRPWVKLVELDSDHALADVQPEIWQEIQVFLS